MVPPKRGSPGLLNSPVTPTLRVSCLSRPQVPLWLAQVLKKRQKCQIIPPEWLNVEFLNEKKEGACTAVKGRKLLTALRAHAASSPAVTPLGIAHLRKWRNA